VYDKLFAETDATGVGFHGLGEIHMVRLATFSLLALVTAMLVGADALAQDGRGERERDDGDREERRDDDDRYRSRNRSDRDSDDDRGRDGERGRGGRRGGFGNREEFWKSQDHNGDGKIAPEEVPSFLRDRVRIETTTSIEELLSRSPGGRRGDDRGDRDQRGGGDNSSRSPATPAVAGFGDVTDEKAKVPGFGPPEKPVQNQAEQSKPRDNNSQSTAVEPGNGGSGGVSSDTFVNGVFKENDSHTNGVLEGDEISAAGNKIPPNADGDGDGKVTRDELVAAVGSKSPAVSNSSKESNATRRSYRFTSAHERLTGSAKSWIVSRDKNADGQVAMHEFSRTWTDSKVREFQRYDPNGDGVVTAAEYEAK
jgi:hypothetical protein